MAKISEHFHEWKIDDVWNEFVNTLTRPDSPFGTVSDTVGADGEFKITAFTNWIVTKGVQDPQEPQGNAGVSASSGNQPRGYKAPPVQPTPGYPASSAKAFGDANWSAGEPAQNAVLVSAPPAGIDNSEVWQLRVKPAPPRLPVPTGKPASEARSYRPPGMPAFMPVPQAAPNPVGFYPLFIAFCFFLAFSRFLAF